MDTGRVLECVATDVAKRKAYPKRFKHFVCSKCQVKALYPWSVGGPDGWSKIKISDFTYRENKHSIGGIIATVTFCPQCRPYWRDLPRREEIERRVVQAIGGSA